MRFLSVLLGLMCLPVLLLAILTAPLWAPILLLLALIVPGLRAFSRTSKRRRWSLATYHSPHSLTWRWGIGFAIGSILTKPFLRLNGGSPFIGFGFSIGLAGAHVYTNNYGWQFGVWLLGLHFDLHQQRPMWYRDIYKRDQRDYGDRMQINALVREEWREGVSAGAAARQVCRSLGAHGLAPSLKRLLEEMLGDANRDNFDRQMILSAFDRADPAAAQEARMASFYRCNPHVEAVPDATEVAMPAAVH